MARRSLRLRGLVLFKVTLILSLVVLAGTALAAGLAPNSQLVAISTNVTGGDIEANSQFIVVIYHSAAANGQGTVRVKPATPGQGWLTSTPVGFGAQTRIAFDPNNNAMAYAAWVDSSGSVEQIKYARCQLAPTVSPTCTTGTVYSAPVNKDLQAADIVVGGNTIYVAWENFSDHQVYTARTTTANLSGWTIQPIQKSGSARDSSPVLAWSNGSVHLAFLRGSSVNPNQVIYLRDYVTNTQTKSFGFIVFQYVSSRPSLVARNSNVYLAWDAYLPGEPEGEKAHYALMRAASTDNGSSWGNPRLITSDHNALSEAIPGDANKYSDLSGPPVDQIGLRPSLAITGTGFAVVWQASPDPNGCSSLPASTANEIHYTYYNGSTWTTVATLSDNKATGDPSKYTYNIAADLAIPTSGLPAGSLGHFIFLRDPQTSQCTGGNYPEYTLYYWGPIQKRDLDKGDGGWKTFLPAVLKNRK